MATGGNRPLKKAQVLSNPTTIKCLHCNEKLNAKDFYDSDSEIYRANGKIPYCKDCLDEIYQGYLKKYKSDSYTEPERKAVERICMAVDLYYSNKIFDSAVKQSESGKFLDTTFISLYFKQAKLYQYRNKNYDTTVQEKFKAAKAAEAIMPVYTEYDIKVDERVKEAMKIFGTGFDKEDYIYLYNEYTDWITRHECDTKAKESLIQEICFVKLNLWKANRTGGDTRDLNTTLTKLMDAAKLQPKQNAGDTTAETQTFGTLIDKWENTRPLPEIDEELKDVDKIGVYLDVFFRGHLAKMMGLKNGLSKLYDNYIKKYTVERSEYASDEDAEALFDAIFGSASLQDEEEVV